MSIYVRKPGSTKKIFVAGLGKPGPAGSGGVVYEAGDGIVITTTQAGEEIRVKVPVQPLTRAEYNALSAEDKQKEVLYVISDEEDAGEGGSGNGSGAAGVSSFNGRSGAVVPQTGDYTAEMVGALPSDTTIPSKTSGLTNDSGFITQTELDAAIQAAVLDSWEASY